MTNEVEVGVDLDALNQLRLFDTRSRPDAGGVALDYLDIQSKIPIS